LVITIRKGSGKLVQQTIGGMPTNDRPVIVQPNDTGIPSARSKVARHRPPHNLSRKILDLPPQTEVGNSEDTFIVYEGHSEGRVGAAPWTNKPRLGVTATRRSTFSQRPRR